MHASKSRAFPSITLVRNSLCPAILSSWTVANTHALCRVIVSLFLQFERTHKDRCTKDSACWIFVLRVTRNNLGSIPVGGPIVDFFPQLFLAWIWVVYNSMWKTLWTFRIYPTLSEVPKIYPQNLRHPCISSHLNINNNYSTNLQPLIIFIEAMLVWWGL